MNKDILILIPTKNEVLNLDDIISNLEINFPMSSYLFVDDSSTDGTFEKLNKFQSDKKNIYVSSRLGSNANIALSYLSGYEFAQRNSIAYIGQLDCDGQHSVRDLKKMYEQKGDFDMVIGSRYIAGGQVLGWSRIRILLSKGANMYLHLLFPKLKVADATSGIRITRTKIIEKIWTDPPDSRGFSFHAESTIKAFKSGTKIKEYPITFSPRSNGKSKMNLRRALESLYRFLIWRLKY